MKRFPALDLDFLQGSMSHQCSSVWENGGSLQAGYKPQTGLWLWATKTAGGALDDHWSRFREEQGQGLTYTHKNALIGNLNYKHLDTELEESFLYCPLLKLWTSLWILVSLSDPSKWGFAGLLQRRCSDCYVSTVILFRPCECYLLRS